MIKMVEIMLRSFFLGKETIEGNKVSFWILLLYFLKIKIRVSVLFVLAIQGLAYLNGLTVAYISNEM